MWQKSVLPPATWYETRSMWDPMLSARADYRVCSSATRASSDVLVQVLSESHRDVPRHVLHRHSLGSGAWIFETPGGAQYLHSLVGQQHGTFVVMPPTWSGQQPMLIGGISEVVHEHVAQNRRITFHASCGTSSRRWSMAGVSELLPRKRWGLVLPWKTEMSSSRKRDIPSQHQRNHYRGIVVQYRRSHALRALP